MQVYAMGHGSFWVAKLLGIMPQLMRLVWGFTESCVVNAGQLGSSLRVERSGTAMLGGGRGNLALQTQDSWGVECN